MFKTLAEISKEQGSFTNLAINLMLTGADLFDLERRYVIEVPQGRRKAGRPAKCILASYNFIGWRRGETVGKFTAYTYEEAIQKAETLIAKSTA